FIIALSVLIMFINIVKSRSQARRQNIVVGNDPWDARSLEWMVPNPTPAHNFDEVPIVTHLDEFWHRKYGEDEGGRPVRIAETDVSSEKLGMWVFLGSECLLYGGLISTYMLYKGTALRGPRPHDIYDIPFTSVSSFVLLMSSMTMVLALSAIQRGEHQRCRVWLVTTALL